jgi:hypothetical protein
VLFEVDSYAGVEGAVEIAREFQYYFLAVH